MAKKKTVENPHVDPAYAETLEPPRRGSKAVRESLTNLALVTKAVSDILVSVDKMTDDARVLGSKIEGLLDGKLAVLDNDVAVLVSDLSVALKQTHESLSGIRADRK